MVGMATFFPASRSLSTGLNCLHIAAQFGFTNIVAYYITCHIPMVTVMYVYCVL